VFICPAGEYSKRLAAFLTQAGHDAAGLAGGVVAWCDAGLLLETSFTRGNLAQTRSEVT
jgi:rhodanese-related sulfurtransferase